MSQKFPVNNFEWIEDSSQFNEDFIKNYNAESDEGYFVEVNVQCPENLLSLHNGLPFLLGRMQIEKVKNLQLIYMIKLNIRKEIKSCKTSIKSWISFENIP